MTAVQISVPDQKRQDALYLPRHWTNIQRYSKQRSSDGRMGVTKFVAGDYMGSAHFEFGAVPATWKALRTIGKAKQLKTTHYAIHPDGPGKKKTLSMWAISHTDSDYQEMSSRFQRLAHDRPGFHLEEPTYFDEHFNVPPRPYSESRREQVAWLVLDERFPVFWTIDKQLADAMFVELQIDKGVKAEDLYLFQEVTFDHAGRTHKGSVVGIYDGHAQINCDDSNLKGRQKISYSEIWKT